MIEKQLDFLRLLEGMRNDFLNTFFECITILGEETLLVIAIVILWFAIDKHIARKIFFIIVTSLGVNGVIKNFVKMPRPFADGKISCVRAETATGYSFPSGHTQNFSTWSTFAAIKARKKIITFLVAFFIFMVAFSRMFLGVHYPMDVIGGTILGVGLAFLGNYAFDKAENKLSVHLWDIALFFPFALWFIISPDLLYADFFKVYGMMAGAYAGIICEEKFAPLTYNIPLWKKIIRVIVGVVLALVLKTVLKEMFVFENVRLSLIFESVRYCVLIFVMTGLCPAWFKKFNM